MYQSWMSIVIAGGCVMAVVLIRLHNQGRLHSVVAQMMARLKRRAEGNNGAHRTTSVRDEEEKAGCQQIELTGGTHNRFQCDIVLLGSEQPLTPPIPRLRFDAVGSRRVLQALTGTADKPSARDLAAASRAHRRKLYRLASRCFSNWSQASHRQVGARDRVMAAIHLRLLARASALTCPRKKTMLQPPWPRSAGVSVRGLGNAARRAAGSQGSTAAAQGEDATEPLPISSRFVTWAYANKLVVKLDASSLDSNMRLGFETRTGGDGGNLPGGGASSTTVPRMSQAAPAGTCIPDTLETAYRDRLLALLAAQPEVIAGQETRETETGQDAAHFCQETLTQGRGAPRHSLGHSLADAAVGLGKQELRPRAPVDAHDELDSYGYSKEFGCGDEVEALRGAPVSSLTTEDILYREFRLAVAYSLDEFKKYSCQR